MLRILIICLLISMTQVLFAQDYIEWAYKDRLTFEEIDRRMTAYFADRDKGRGSGYKPYKRWAYRASRALDENGRVIPDYVANERAKQFRMRKARSRSNTSNQFIDLGPSDATNTSTWSSHLGRLSGLSVQPNDHDHMIVSSPTGGIWKTTDHGANWVPIFDDRPTMEIYAVEISPHDPSIYLAGSQFMGIFRSTDGGLTWQQTTGEVDNDRYNRILFHPTNPNVVLACNEFDGEIFRSTDAGQTWTLVHSTAPRNLYDMEFKPGDPSVVYASGNSQVLKSTNGGLSFSQVSGPWTGTANAIMLGVTPASPSTVYALEERSGGMEAIHRSDNEMGLWTTPIQYNGFNNYMGYDQDVQSGQGPRDQDIAISPSSVNEVHVAGVETWKSVNGANSFSKTTSWLLSSSLPFVHADIDLMKFYGDTLFVGTDGGIFYSTDGAASFEDITPGISVRQFYRIGVSATDSNRIVGGSQDNGTGVFRGDGWYDWLGADGMECFVDWSNNNNLFGAIQFGDPLYRSTNGGNTRFTLTDPITGPGEWVTPFEQDPCTANQLYVGMEQVERSTNYGSSWSIISSFPGTTLIDEMKIAPSDCNTIYVARKSNVYKTNNGGTTWSNITPSSISRVNYIAVHPQDPQRLTLALVGASAKYVESIDGGATWTDITYGLPDISPECVAYEPSATGGMWVGMRPGIYYLPDGQTSWQDQSANLPNVQIGEIEIDHGLLYVGTYGRGLWKRRILEQNGETCAAALSINTEELVGCAPDTVTTSVSALNSGGGATHADANHAKWYQFSVPQSGLYTIDACQAGVNTRLFIYEGNCGALVPLDSSDNDCGQGAIIQDIQLDANQPVYLEWDDRWSTAGFDFLIYSSGGLQGYNCEAPITLTQQGTYTAPGPDQCFGALNTNAEHANWYQLVPSVTGELTISACDGGADTRVWVYSGTCDDLQLLGNNDDLCTLNGSGTSPYASFVDGIKIFEGQPILIEWDNRWSTRSFTFIITELETPCVSSFTDAGFGQLRGIQSYDATHKTDGAIMSSQTLPPGVDVIYDAAGSIDLLDSFEVKQGAIFETKNDGCD